MDRNELRALGKRLLGEARALQAVFPNESALRAVTLSVFNLEPFDGDEVADTFGAALRYLRDEMILVRDGKADTLTVLTDEMNNTESLLPHL